MEARRNGLLVLISLMISLPVFGLTSSQRAVIYNGLPDVLQWLEPGDPVFTSYALEDLDGDGVEDLVLQSLDASVYRAYSTARDMKPIPVADEVVGRILQTGFAPINTIFSVLAPKTDYTLSQRPLLAVADQGKNEYVARILNGEESSYRPMKEYTNMVFKPHVGKVRHVKAEESVTDDQYYCYYHFFGLKDPSFSKKMFRGYADSEIMSVIVTDEFLTTHIPQQYSRWKSPEPIRRIGDGYKQVVEEFFGRSVKRSQWLASLPTEVSTRDFFLVSFATVGENVCSAFVCVAEGCVQSYLIIEGYLEGGEEVYYDSDIDSLYSEHQPEIMAIMDGPMGLELYVRHNSMEGTHYSVWRELGMAWVEVIDEYYYWDMN